MNIDELKNFMFAKLELLLIDNQKKAVKMRQVIAICKRLAKKNPVLTNTTFETKPAISIVLLNSKSILRQTARLLSDIAKLESDILYIF